jgi:hypothetical protein
MRLAVFAVVSIVCAMGPTIAQPADQAAVPRVIGNRANGFDYQPTPQEVRPREILAGARPPGSHEALTNQDLGELDRRLLQSEGLSTKNVPKFELGE